MQAQASVCWSPFPEPVGQHWPCGLASVTMGGDSVGCEYQEMYLCVCQGMAARSRDGQKLQPLSALAGAQGVWVPAYQADHHSHLNSCQSDWNFVFL